MTSGVGEGDGSGVTTTVGTVGRSGGGSIQFSTSADQRSKRSPMPEDIGLDDGETGDEQENEDERGNRPALSDEGVHGWLGRE